MSGLDVDDPGDILAVFGGKPADDDLGLLDDLRIEELLEAVLDGRRQLDPVNPQLHAGEVPAHVDGAVVVLVQPGVVLTTSFIARVEPPGRFAISGWPITVVEVPSWVGSGARVDCTVVR